MELRQLRAFREVVRAGTFRAAAAKLHLTQPALWQQVRALQEELGLPLFERVGRRVRLTRSGMQLLEQADDVIGAADRLGELATAMSEGREGILSLATPAPPMELLLAEAIGEFSRAFPSVRVDIHDTATMTGGPLDALRSGQVDLAVAPREKGFEGFRLFTVDVMLVVAADHPWSQRRRVEVGKVEGKPLLTPPVGSLSRRLLTEACAAVGFEPIVRLASGSPGMLIALARAGFGMAVLASDALIGTGVTTMPALVNAGRTLRTEAWLYWRPGPRSRVLDQFIERVRARVRDPVTSRKH